MKHFICFLLAISLSGSAAWAQGALTVHGKVTSAADQQPLIGATVTVKGSTTATMTDVNGAFTLSVPAGSALTFTYLGYESVTRPAAATMDVKMQESSASLDEVVVTGMQRIDKRMFTGATDQLKASDVQLGGVPDISRALEGRSAGVSVQNVSGTFGTAPKIRVRGATSIYGSSSPLWVVDGVVMENVVEVDADALSSGDAATLISSAVPGLNEADIESFQILKDGSATSIYGARAMAGVIVVTTKRGKAGSTRINYSGDFTFRFTPRYSEFNIMNSQEQMDVYRELQMKGWLNFSDTYRASESGIFGKMYQLMNTYDPVTGTFALANTKEAQEAYLRAAERRNTDWFGQLFSTAIQRTHAVSISSGTEKSTMYASMGVLQDPGWSKASEVSRYTASLNASYNVFERLTATLTFNGSYREQRAPGTLSQTTDPFYGEVRRSFDINPYSFALNTSRALDPDEFYTRNYAPFNIFHELDNNYIDINVGDLKFQGELSWRPLDALTFKAIGAIKYNLTSQERYVKDDANQAEAYRAMPDAVVRDNNPYLYKNPDAPYELPISILPEGGIYARNDYKMKSYDVLARAEWNKVFDGVHATNALLGAEINSIDRHTSAFNGWGMQYSQGEIPFYVYEFFKQSIERGNQYYGLGNYHTRAAAFYANGTYSYGGRYTLNGTLRYEGTNKLGKSRAARWLPTWNVGLAWNAHEESFWAGVNPKVMSHFTVKGSYSLTADRGPASVTNSLMVLSAYNPYRPFTNIQESGLVIADLENSELTYEKKHELNIGASIGLVNNRINVEADWFQRNNYDLIGLVNTQGVGGVITKTANVATMTSGGVELTLTSKNFDGNDFKWSTTFIYGYNHNKVTQLESQNMLVDFVTGSGFTSKGYPVRSLFSIPFAGLNDAGLPTFYTDAEHTKTTVSGVNFQDYNSLSYLIYEGPSEPTSTGSLGNIFTWKGIRLNVFITYSFGNKIRLDPVFSSSYSDLTVSPREFANRWVLPGDEAYTNVPVIANHRQVIDDNMLPIAYNSYNYSDIRIADGGFVRMKEISLSYDIPGDLLRRIKLSSVQLRLSGTNLFLIYADKKLNGQDPEFVQAGGVALPMAKQVTLSVKIGI